MSTDTHTHTQSIKIALLNWPSWPCRCRNNVRVCVCACVEGGRVRRCDHSQHSVKSYHRLQPVIMSSSNHCVCVCVCPSEVLQNSHYFVTRVTPAKRDYIRDQTQDTPMNIDLFFLLFLSLLSRWWIDTIQDYICISKLQRSRMTCREVTWKSATCWPRPLQPAHRVWHPLRSLCCWFWRVKIQLVWNLILPVHWLCLNRLNWLCEREKVRSRWEESISTQQLMCHF